MLFLLAHELSGAEERKVLKDFFNTNPPDPSQKIETVKKIFIKSGAVTQIQQLMKEYTQKALKEVESFPIIKDKKLIFKAFALELMERKL